MAQIPHVQPGDLVTSELINAIIDALGTIDQKIVTIDQKIVTLDQKITKCCEQISKPPEKTPISILDVQPPQGIYKETVNIIGSGFVPDTGGNAVTIGDVKVVDFGKVTESLIQAVVPVLKFKTMTAVPIVVENRNGAAKARFSAGPEKPGDVVFVPTPKEVVDEMLKVAGVNKADIVYDLGSGDGRIVIAAAEKFNARKAVGVELDSSLIKVALAAAKDAGVSDRVSFVNGDLFTADLSEATVITIHLLPALNLKLRPTFEKLKAGTRIVSHSFDMGDWKPVQHSNLNGHDVYLWVVGK